MLPYYSTKQQQHNEIFDKSLNHLMLYYIEF